MREFVRIGADVVVIPRDNVLRECEDDDEKDSGRGCGETIGNLTDQPVEDDHEYDKQSEIHPHERSQADAKDGEPQGVDVRRERPAEVGEVVIKRPAFGDLPGEMKLAAEVDEDVGPGVPCPGGHDDADACDDNCGDKAHPLRWVGFIWLA